MSKLLSFHITLPFMLRADPEPFDTQMYDQCAKCQKPTDYLRETPLEFRSGYTEDGQLCRECIDSQDLRNKNTEKLTTAQ